MKDILSKLKTEGLLNNIPVHALILSLFLGVLATALVVFYIQAQTLTIAGGRQVPVVFATKNIAAASVVTDDLIEIRNVPQAYLQFGCIQAKEKTFLLGQKTANAIDKGEAVLWYDVKLEALQTLEQKLSPGERAISIAVNAESSVNGFITPGDRVDVFVTYTVPCELCTDKSSSQKMPAGTQITKTKMLLQNIVVLAVDSNMYPQSTEFENVEKGQSLTGAQAKASTQHMGSGTVTLKLTPDQAAMFIFAEQEGNIKLALRDKQDVVVEPVADVCIKKLVAFDSVKNSIDNTMMDMGQKGYPVIFEEGQKKGDSFIPDKSFGSKFTPLPQKTKSQETGEIYKY